MRSRPLICVATLVAAACSDGIGLAHYVTVHGRARVTEGGAPELLQRLAEVYLGPGVPFPPMPDPPPGYVTRVRVERIAGQGPWIQSSPSQ